MILKRKKLSSIYRIEDGVIYYKCCDGNTYNREVCPAIVELLTKKRRLKLAGEKPLFKTFICENELRAINNYITGCDEKFTMIKPYRKQVVRALGDIEIKSNKKQIK